MTLHFNDIAHYQGANFPVTGAALLAKATEGTSFVDSCYAGNKTHAVAKGVPFGGYHYLDPGSIGAQATHAFKVMGKTPAMLDVERSTGGNASWAETKAFITAYRKLGGVMHLAYIPAWYHRDEWGSPDLTWLTANGVALISSSYVHTYSDTGVGWHSYGGVRPLIWQYTDGDTSRGFSAGLNHVDTNAFKGTVAQLAQVFATGKTQPEDEMTPAEMAEIKKAITDTVAAAKVDILAEVGAKVWGHDPNDMIDPAKAGIATPYFQPDHASNPTAAARWFPTQALLALHEIGKKLGVDIAGLANKQS